jgi:predicted HAD superfamily Cof-like phosphohydrolase
MHEELSEFIQADNLVDKADALVDLIYVALGTAYGLGLPFNPIWEAVHEANMQKVSGQTKRGNKVDAMKPPGWTGPEIRIKAIIDAAVTTEK